MAMLRRPPVVCRRPSSSMSKIFSSETAPCGAALGRGNESLYELSRSHDQDGRNAHIYYKNIKKLLFWNRWTDFNATWYVPLVDFDPFYGKLNFGYIGFSMEKAKKIKFSGSFVACDLKVGRYRQHVELMKCC